MRCGGWSDETRAAVDVQCFAVHEAVAHQEHDRSTDLVRCAQAAKRQLLLQRRHIGVAPVTAFDFRRYTLPAGSLALRIGEAFRQLTLDTEES